ncbi:MAG: L,D-transpeptidase family protein [Hyphomicrobiaceae bacterium]|nr:L,D-transpeptidase family protein [Hyphomicrobiaceae bacterium]
MRHSVVLSTTLACAAGSLLAVTLPVPVASAQSYGYSSPYFTSSGQRSRPARAKPSRPSAARSARAAKVAEKTPGLATAGPLTLVVSLGQQRVTIYDRNGMVTSSPISSGAAGHRTPTGVYSILEKNRVHYSNLYANAPMPNMQRITWSGVALHAGHLPGYPASHGCIRLPYSFSRTLFSTTTLGTRVIVAHDSPEPQVIAHANLLKPLPPGVPDAAPPVVQHDTSPAAGRRASDAARMMLGVSQANAAGPADQPADAQGPPTRASVAAARQRQLAALEAAAKDSATWRADAHAQVVAANADLRAALDALAAARKTVGDIDKRIRDALAAKAAADGKLKAFLVKTGQLSDPAKIATAESEEDRIEAEALAALAAYDMANADRRQIDGSIAALQQAAEQTEQRRAALSAVLKTATEAVAQASGSLAAAQRALKRADKPITVLISRKAGKIYVRQGWDDLMEAPIEIASPSVPLGTQVFHAVGYTADGHDLEWRALTAARAVPKVQRRVIGRERGRPIYAEVPVETASLPQTPAAALERVKIPAEIAEVLAEHIKPNSAIIITDEGKSPETGKFTDLIVSTY